MVASALSLYIIKNNVAGPQRTYVGDRLSLDKYFFEGREEEECMSGGRMEPRGNVIKEPRKNEAKRRLYFGPVIDIQPIVSSSRLCVSVCVCLCLYVCVRIRANVFVMLLHNC